MDKQEQHTDEKTVTRRDILKSVGKYSAAATGATVVALSANQALAQASSSDEWVCTDHYPWWLCWWLGLSKVGQTDSYGGWDGYSETEAEPDYLGKSDKPW
ncbi:MAG: hypothetical protein ACRBBS_08575 [Thalassovita sp.]